MRPTRPRSLRGRLAAPFAGLAGVAVAWPCVRLGWVDYDESFYARDNLYLLDLGDAWTLVTSAGPAYQFQPTTYLSHAIDYAAFGDSVAWFHLSSVLLYAVCCYLVAHLTQVLSREWGLPGRGAARAGFLAGLAFAVHPVHVECYAWLGDRKDLLACALGIGSYLTYRRLPALVNRRRRLLTHCLAAALLTAALGAKLTAAPLGGCLALEGWLRARGGLRARLTAALHWGAPALALGFVLSLAWYALQAQYPLPLSRPSPGHSVPERAAYVLRCYGHYVRLLGWPTDLAVHYFPRARVAEWGVNLGWLLIGAAGVALAARDRVQRPVALWAAGWFVMTLVLVSNVMFLGYVNDRYLLLPSVAVAVFAGVWAARGEKRLGIVLGLCAVWVVQSAAQIPTWASARSLWTQALEVDPQHPFGLAKLGMLAAEAGRLDEAQRYADAALAEALGTDYPVLLQATLLDLRGEREAAKALLLEQAATSPEVTVVLHLAARELSAGYVARAEVYANHALEREPRSLRALELSAECALRRGDASRALELCEAGLESAAPVGLTLLATRCAVALGAWQRAARYLGWVERAQRDWETALLGAEIELNLRGPDAAAARLDDCLERVPRDLVGAVLKLASLLERSARGVDALRVLREAALLEPGQLLTRAHFEALYGDPQAARADLQRALLEAPQLRPRALANPALRDLLGN